MSAAKHVNGDGYIAQSAAGAVICAGTGAPMELCVDRDHRHAPLTASSQDLIAALNAARKVVARNDELIEGMQIRAEELGARIAVLSRSEARDWRREENGALSDADCGDLMHRCYRARLIGEAARMGGEPADANPYGTFADDDDSPNALIAADWRYGWEHQDWVEQRAGDRRQDRDWMIDRVFRRRPLFTPLHPDRQPLNREELAALVSSNDIIVRRLLATIDQQERVIVDSYTCCDPAGLHREVVELRDLIGQLVAKLEQEQAKEAEP